MRRWEERQRERPFSTGTIQSKFNLMTTAVPGANAAIVFDYMKTPVRYRFVKITSTNVIIGQVGAIGTDPAGTLATIPLKLTPNAVHTVKVVINTSGRVNVFLDGSKKVLVGFTFKTKSAGQIGLQATNSKTQFDDFLSSK